MPELASGVAAVHTVRMKSRLSELRSVDLFGGLTDQQLSELVAGSTEISLRPGLELFREGEHADFWWVLLDGVVDLVRRVGREETIVAKMDVPGRWAGGFRAWDDQGVYLATGRAATTGRVLRIPAEVLREWVSAWLPLGGYLIEGLYRTARSIEATARQRQSLVTLGTLAAGLAHEINNPAAATVRAVDALEDACQALLASVSQFAAQRVSAQQLGALDMLRQESHVRRSRWTRWRWPTRRKPWHRGLPAMVSAANGRSRPHWPLPVPTSAGATGRPVSWMGQLWSRAWSGWQAPCRSPRCWPK